MNSVLLLSMPFGAMERPSLGISLLKARLSEIGIDCDVRYLALTFAEFVGADDYQLMCHGLPYTAFAGDWVFTSALYGDRPDADRDYVQRVLREMWRLSEHLITRILRVRSMVPYFLDHCMAALPWQDYAVIGFTSTFEQNIASLALARKIKAAHPEVTTVFGGANWEAEMGQELHRRFSFVDYVCSGEAEESFPLLVSRVLGGESTDTPADPIRGIVYRDASGESIDTGAAPMIRAMDQLPIPDFRDYFRDLEQCTVSLSIAPTLLFETSRGCWWGAKKHCTFCGLNGGTMAFRSKSARRALDELAYLVDRWQIDQVEAVDNILDMKYFRDLLPELARARREIQLFYEVKANLSRKQIGLLAEAGVRRIQPGIESLSDHVLELMRKGTTGLRNIQLLKWAQEHEITVEWNLLYGFPGETREDYDEILGFLPAIRFLRPPVAVGPIRLDRFSPYYNAPEEFGLHNVRPIVAYGYLYPFEAESLSRIAYYFDFDYEPGFVPADHAGAVIAYAEEWQRNPERGALHSVPGADGAITLIDTRCDATVEQVTLSGLERAAYELCDELHAGTSVVRYLRETFPGVEFAPQRVLAFLDSLVAHKLMITDGTNYLSLAIARRAESPSSAVAGLRETRPTSGDLAGALEVTLG